MENRSESWFCGEVKILLRKDLPMLIYNGYMLRDIGRHMNIDFQKEWQLGENYLAHSSLRNRHPSGNRK